MRVPALIMLSALICSSCSIKEARNACPCRLEIDYSAFANVAQSVCLELDGRVIERSVSEGQDMAPVFQVPKKESIRVTVWSGGQSDSLFLFGASVPGMDETAAVSAVPHKQFASVLLRVFSADDGSVSYTVKSNYSGIDLTTAQAVPGNLVIPLDGYGGGDHIFRLPRQAPESALTLEAGYANGVVQVYPLGEWIKMAGYDWTAADLDDIMVGADFALGHYEVRIGEWDAGDASDQIL